jgi:phenylacetic acid degradation operon negative regulatory protein
MMKVRNTGGSGSPEFGDDTTLLPRPLSARSVIGSLLLGVHPPRLPGARIVEWCTRFGISEGTARVALSRMVDRGELVTDEGFYELSGRVRDLQGPQDWSLEPQLNPWSGAWRVGIVADATHGRSARTAPDRAALRSAMRRLRHVELREGVWTRPDNLPAAAAPGDAWAVAAAQCSWWTGMPDADPGRLVATLFGPAAWADRARTLLERLEPVTDALDSGRDDALAAGFVTGAATLQHARRDPLLPAALLPADWPGDDLRCAYARFQTAFAASLSAVFRR